MGRYGDGVDRVLGGCAELRLTLNQLEDLVVMVVVVDELNSGGYKE